MAANATMTIDGIEYQDVEFVMHSVRESFGEPIEVVEVSNDEAVFRPAIKAHFNASEAEAVLTPVNGARLV